MDTSTIFDTAFRSPAEDELRGANPRMFIGEQNGLIIGIEDYYDDDNQGHGRRYRLEYRSTPDCLHAVSFCIRNPWPREPGAWPGHIDWGHGLICTGEGMHELRPNPCTLAQVSRSPLDLITIIQNTRGWVALYTHYRETGAWG